MRLMGRDATQKAVELEVAKIMLGKQDDFRTFFSLTQNKQWFERYKWASKNLQAEPESLLRKDKKFGDVRVMDMPKIAIVVSRSRYGALLKQRYGRLIFGEEAKSLTLHWTNSHGTFAVRKRRSGPKKSQSISKEKAAKTLFRWNGWSVYTEPAPSSSR